MILDEELVIINKVKKHLKDNYIVNRRGNDIWWG